MYTNWNVSSVYSIRTFSATNRYPTRSELSRVAGRSFTEVLVGPSLIKCLSFAHNWGFAPQKSHLIKLINNSGSPAERIAAGRLLIEPSLHATEPSANKRPDPEYFVQPFIDLCKEPITAEQAELLGDDDSVRYAQILHHLRYLDQYHLSVEQYIRGILVKGFNPSNLNGISVNGR